LTATWDVIIAGGGPAGSTLGYELGKQGLKTLLIDKAKFPRYKTCGGIVDIKAANSLPFDISPVVEDAITRVMISRKLGQPFTKDCGGPITYNVSRERFDHFLLQKAIEAGCTVEQGDGIKSIEMNDNGVTAVTKEGQKFTGKILAGADGANSVVARAVGLLQNAYIGIGLEWEVEVDPADLEQWRGVSLLDLGTISSGYAWIFPKLDHLSLGAGGGQEESQAVRVYYQNFIDKWKPTFKKCQTIREKGHRLPVRRKGDPIVQDRVILLGDAAGLIDPLSGEGIYYAIKSGQLAGRALAAHLADPHNVPLAHYQTLVDTEIMAEIQRAKAFMRLFYLYPRPFISSLKRSNRLWRATCALLTGQKKYSDIGKKLGPAEFILDRLAW
jgi:geranylgeranyl reductase family protein